MIRWLLIGGWLAWRGISNRFVLAAGCLLALFAFANLYHFIPGGDVNNRVAAFEVNTIGLLLSIDLLLVYILIVHPTRSLSEVAAKLMMALLFMLQTIEVLMATICSAAQNPITATAGGWGVDSAKALCNRVVGPGPLIVQIVVGLSIAGYIIWRYRKAVRTTSG